MCIETMSWCLFQDIPNPLCVELQSHSLHPFHVVGRVHDKIFHLKDEVSAFVLRPFILSAKITKIM